MVQPLDLSGKEIRILDVEPGDSLQDPVHASLRNISLSSSSTTEYETISYVWGDPKDTATVFIDGVTMTVPKNAETALRYLRSTHRTLWMDCICINQVDLEELNHQVPFMGEVYAKSKGNIVWLGESDPDTADAVHSILELVSEASSETNGFQNMFEVLYTPQHRRRWAATKFSVECDFSALQQFFSNQWFRRLWVLQEVVRAPSNICYCGQISVQLLDVVRVAKWIRYKGYHLPEGIDKSVFKSAGVMWEHVDHEYGWSAHHQTDLRELYQLVMYFDVSIPHDKVYAVLGLHPASVTSQVISTYFGVDYSRPFRDVLMDATKATLEAGRSLTLLRVISHGTVHLANIEEESQLGIPTWVPRLDHRRDDQDGLPLPDHFSANALRPFIPQPGFRESPYLQINGTSVGNIIEVATPVRLADVRDKVRLDRYITACEMITRETGSSESNERASLTEALAHTLIAGTNAASNLAGRHEVEGFLAWRELVRREASSDSQERGTNPTAYNTISEYDIAFRTGSIGRCFFRTTHGRLGVGPPGTSTGDIAVVACGSELPFILRPLGDKVLFVGVAYVHGVMFGAGWSDDAQVEKFDVI